MLDRTVLILLSFGLAAAGQTTTPTPAHATHTPSKAVSKSAPAAAQPEAILHTTAGDLKCELFPSQAPKAVANFIGLAKGTKSWKDSSGKQVTGRPLYDGVIFHRVIPTFMIQGGDPSGTGSGDIGFEFVDELHADLLFDKPGRLAMANRGPNTNSSQFFITEAPQPGLNPCLDEGGCQKPWGHVEKNTGYTIFGQCDDAAVELVKKIARMPCQAGPCDGRNSRPQNPVKITHIEIVKPGGTAAKPSAGKPAASKPAQPKSTPVAQ
ncbi:MAG TPA: peptidylprolyl isomerase [Candidatus Angelobacter sp.]